ncbi:hypothetical protein CORC01_10448 [Colletotrichum orchidophilum]|uniref:Uncharacterized protein n=1 Tax=Colletotrichum orchidophilum TaxID=1209926 RepID=A0A1G4AYP1_9PEZI|nr:uncharacterized protein CORC01_10448 [Colletotrichum orchidophilum]OHE94288.1 hypothetical protein CORC01_10448 [Colletotrichum orchidophilum]
MPFTRAVSSTCGPSRPLIQRLGERVSQWSMAATHHA